jgi:hypothetical protein
MLKGYPGCFIQFDFSSAHFQNVEVKDFSTIKSIDKEWGLVSRSNFVIDDCKFGGIGTTNKNNIFSLSSSSILNITKSTFSNIQQTFILSQTGLIYLNEIILDITNKNFLTSAIRCINCKAFQMNSSNVELKGFTHLNSLILKGGLFSFENTVTITDSNLLSLQEYLIYKCIMKGAASKEKGGFLFASGKVNMKIHSNEFHNGKSKMGGAINFECSTAFEYCFMDIKQNIFKENFALEGGGAINWAFKIPENIEDNTFISNKASFGANVTSYPSRISVDIIDENNRTYSLSDHFRKEKKIFKLNHKSGQKLKYTICISVLDTYGQKILNIPRESIFQVSLIQQVSNSNVSNKFDLIQSKTMESTISEAIYQNISTNFYTYQAPIMFG